MNTDFPGPPPDGPEASASPATAGAPLPDPVRRELAEQREVNLHLTTDLEVLQRGYRRGESVFRPARVVVNDLTRPTPARHGR
jgi:hypothetical protein